MILMALIHRNRLLTGALFAALAIGVVMGMSSAFLAHSLPAASGGVLVQSPQVSSVNMLRQRFETLLDGDLERIRPNYLVEDLGGEYAWDKERERTRYFRAWLLERDLTLTSSSAWFEVDSIASLGRGSYRLEITEHGLYEYRPSANPSGPTHAFGSRTVHVMEIAFSEDRWRIAYDWYADPLGDSAIDPSKGQIAPSASGTRPAPAQEFDRGKAAEYALRYSGVRSLPGGGKYNRSYQVYSYVGGDCANFVSQVLAAGGLPQDYGWAYSRGGSASWTCSQDLIWHLIGSGTGRRVYWGTFAGALLPLPGEPRGAIGLLQPGDVIGYEISGEVAHVAVVAGFDPSGWPVIASHTADRLYSPWDLGWDRDTVFCFIHIVY